MEKKCTGDYDSQGRYSTLQEIPVTGQHLETGDFRRKWRSPLQKSAMGNRDGNRADLLCIRQAEVLMEEEKKSGQMKKEIEK